MQCAKAVRPLLCIAIKIRGWVVGMKLQNSFNNDTKSMVAICLITTGYRSFVERKAKLARSMH